jgi:hypothetical protein
MEPESRPRLIMTTTYMLLHPNRSLPMILFADFMSPAYDTKHARLTSPSLPFQKKK